MEYDVKDSIHSPATQVIALLQQPVTSWSARKLLSEAKEHKD